MAIGTGTALLIGAGVSAIGGVMSSKAQAKGASQAAGVSAAQYNQTREDLAPYQNVGSGALYELGSLYGLPIKGGYPTINQDGTPDSSTPDSSAPNTKNNLLSRLPDLMGRLGRRGDTQIAHVTPGETVVPQKIASQPAVRNALTAGFNAAGMDPGRYVVGGNDDSINPKTGAREFYAASGPADPGNEAGGYNESGGFGAGDFGGTGGYGQGPESQNASGAGGYGGVGGNRDGMIRNRRFNPVATARP